MSSTSRLGQELTKKLVYNRTAVSRRKSDYTLGVCCILEGDPKLLEDENGQKLFECTDVQQVQAAFVYDSHDKVISRFVHLKYTGEEDVFGECNLTIVMPQSMSRTSALHREAVVKAKVGNEWVYMDTEEANMEEYKDSRFVQARFTAGIPSIVCVVSRYKKDTIKFSKQSTRYSSSVDQRLSLKADAGCFSGKVSFTMQVQPVGANTVSHLQTTTPNGHTLLCSSNIVSIAWGAQKFKKSVTINLPIPANPVKIKKLAKIDAQKADSATEKKKRTETKREEKQNKWYMGIYGEDEHDSLFLFHSDFASEKWHYMPDTELVELRKDLLSFRMTKPLHRFVVLRCRAEVTPQDAKKLVHALDEQLLLRPVKLILFQSPKEHSEVTVHCVSVQKFAALYDQLYDSGWRFHGTNGPPSSKTVMLKEGSVLEIAFRGNIKFEERFHPSGTKVFWYYNSELPCHIKFAITEVDKHLQRSYDFFKGVCMVSLAENPMPMDVNQLTIPTDGNHLTVGSAKNSAVSLVHARKAHSQVAPERRNTLITELMLQLAKVVEGGQQTPPAGKLCIELDPLYTQIIQVIAAKLGNEWIALAANLGLTRGRIEALKTRNKSTPDKLKEDMLYTWIKRQPRTPDRLSKLYHALMNCGRIDLAYKVEDVNSGAGDPTPPVEITVTTDSLTTMRSSTQS